MNKELAVVIPFYNEADSLGKLISDWRNVFLAEKINYYFILINDGSADDSLKVATAFMQEEPGIILNQQNAGHGAAILNGYRNAINCDWIFQIDSDHQYSTETFRDMWAKKNQYPFLIAEREEISASFSRKVISLLCSASVRIFFGKKITDINSPYRLIESSLLSECLRHIPPNSFAPNVLMSAYIIKSKRNIYTSPLRFRPAIVPNRSKLNAKLFAGSVQTFLSLFKI